MEVLLLFLTVCPMIGAIIAYILGRRSSKWGENAVIVIAVLHMLLTLCSLGLYKSGDWLETGLLISGFGGFGLYLVLDGFRMILLLLTSFMWLSSVLISPDYFGGSPKKNRYYCFLLITLGAVSGVFLSGDLFTTFLFFEIMSFTSYVWVIHDESEGAMRAGQTYLAIAVLGGMVMLMGIFLLYYHTGTLSYEDFYENVGQFTKKGWSMAAALCLLFGFGAKAGAFPLHVWLPKAHPVAPAPASALLSGILTKTGVFGILLTAVTIMAGNQSFGKLLFGIGTLTMLTGGILALFGMNMKRVLACSSVSQIGFILMGAGILVLLREEGIAAGAGTVIYLINHALFKLLLFSCAAVIYQNAHCLDLNGLRGFGRKKPLLLLLFLSGSLGISGIPLFSGYIGKTLIHEGIAEYGALSGSMLITFSEWLFILGGAMTVAYMMKLCVALFWEENTDASLQEKYNSMRHYISRPAIGVLGVTALLFPLMGVLPHATAERLAVFAFPFLHIESQMPAVSYFGWGSLKYGLLSLVLGALLYLFVIRKFMMKKENGESIYVERWNPKWDLENLVYRPVLYGLMIVAVTVCRVLDRLVDYMVIGLRKTIYRDSAIPHELDEGNLATHYMGHLMDGGKIVLNRTLYRRNPIHASFEHRLALVREEWRENNSIISRSLSFGLFLFGIGLILTLIYMIWL